MLWSPIETSEKPYQKVWIPTIEGTTPPPLDVEPATPLEILYFSDAHGCHLSRDSGWSTRLSNLSKEYSELDGDTLFLDGGDDFGGGEAIDILMTEFSDSGNLLYSLLRHKNVDALCPGNHDFDWGIQVYLDKLPEEAPIAVASNTKEGSALASQLPRIVVFEYADKRVAVIGLANLSQMSNAEDDIIDGANMLPGLMDQALKVANIVIVISHNGTDYDLELLKELPPAVLLCGSHTHETIPPADEPFVSSNYLQSGWKLESFGLARWSPESGWEVRNKSACPISQPTSDATEARLETEVETLLLLQKTVTVNNSKLAGEDLKLDRYRGGSANLNWACDKLAEGHQKAGYRPELAALCSAFLGDKTIKGTLTISDWYRIFPYADRLFETSIPWRALPRLLEKNAQRMLHPPGYREDMGFLHFDRKLEYEVSLSTNGPRIKNLFFDNQIYTEESFDTVPLVTHAYVISGAGGYRELFESIGLWPLPIERESGCVRDLLWQMAKNRPTQEVSRHSSRPPRVSISWNQP